MSRALLRGLIHSYPDALSADSNGRTTPNFLSHTALARQISCKLQRNLFEGSGLGQVEGGAFGVATVSCDDVGMCQRRGPSQVEVYFAAADDRCADT